MEDSRIKLYNDFVSKYNDLIPKITEIMKSGIELHNDLQGEYLLSENPSDHKNVEKMKSVLLRFCNAAEIILSIKDIEQP